MSLIKIRKEWELKEKLVTPEHIYLNRRSFLKSMGIFTAGAWGLMNGFITGRSNAASAITELHDTIPAVAGVYPAPRNPKYKVDRPLTDELTAASHNNFYEFTTTKSKVWTLTDKFKTKPWQIEITGHIKNKMTLDIDDLLKKLPIEERIYRFRCVEAWSMVVPWSGIPFKKLIELVEPTEKAKYIRMVTFNRPKEAPGMRSQPWYPWPYFEGLSMAEAMNELTMLVTGIYGHELPKQHGAPIRLVVPWKYGFKNIKSIVKIEFIEKQPSTFWNKLVPDEYDFTANVDPTVPHPRWSQATERDIGSGNRIPTLPFNGYEKFVGHLYKN
ncbi:MAG: protein-methionine-sulfoxide reductase catalytic subunit MsrP [Calditrichia bacterium]